MGLPEPVGRQSDVAYLPAAGHHVVLGTAGTGKTVMAVLRALYLSDPGVAGSGRTLLVTYNNALVSYLKHFAGKTDRLDIRTYGAFARGFLHHHGAMKGQAIASSSIRRRLIRSALKAVASKYETHKFFERDPGWFEDEIAWISGMGLRTWEAYEAIDRLGRRTPSAPRCARSSGRSRRSTGCSGQRRARRTTGTTWPPPCATTRPGTTGRGCTGT